MKYILKNIKENNRDLEFNIIEKSENHILGEMYEVFGDGKTEPYFYSYITTVNLRYEGIITMNYGKRNKEEIRVSGPNGMLTHMRIQGFLAQIALIESKGRKYYTASFKDVINTGILDGFEVEFLENENFTPSRCKSCACFENYKCTRKSLYSSEIGVCWFDEEY